MSRRVLALLGPEETTQVPSGLTAEPWQPGDGKAGSPEVFDHVSPESSERASRRHAQNLRP